MRAGALYRGRDCVLATVWLADNWGSRLRGLIGREPLVPGRGLLLSPCDGVHTFWMGYPLDVLFLDRAGSVLGWRENVRPWRACRHAGARSTLELSAGGIAALRPSRGEILGWQPAALTTRRDAARRSVVQRDGSTSTTSGMEPGE